MNDYLFAGLGRSRVIEGERAARAEILDESQELTTDMLDRYDRAKAAREALGVTDAEVGPWEQERDERTR